MSSSAGNTVGQANRGTRHLRSVGPLGAGGEAISADSLASLRAEIVRLEEQFSAYEDRVRLTDILGGIGYIVGITGAAYYYLGARRRKTTL